jgi:lipopolysaccharide export system protein LptA
MSKKTVIQLFLLFVIFIIFFITFNAYFLNKNEEQVFERVIIKDNKSNLLKESSNLIKNITYKAEDQRGNNYTILSEFGELNENMSGLIFMTNVTAIINMKDKSQIKISSNKATYNSSNYNSEFRDNILMIYGNNKITSEKLDLMFEKNIAIIFDNVIYKNLNTQLEADKIEINLMTKSSKIFMNKKSEKVKIISLN